MVRVKCHFHGLLGGRFCCLHLLRGSRNSGKAVTLQLPFGGFDPRGVNRVVCFRLSN